MKKFIALCLALTMALSLAACGGQNVNTPNVGSSDNSSSNSSSDLPSENGGGATDAAGTGTANACSVPLPTPYALYEELSQYTEFTYDYLGFSYKLPKELQEKLVAGEMSLYIDSNWMSNGREFNYTMLYFQVAEDKNLTEDMLMGETDDAYFQWLSTTKRVGTITVIHSDYLKDNAIESITGCEENEEIGKSSDGQYVFYRSTNPVDNATELFSAIEITTFDPKVIPEIEPGICVAVNLLEGDRK